MNKILDKISEITTEAIEKIYNIEFDKNQIVIQTTRPDIEGDFTLVVFPFTKFSKKKPAETAEELGQYIVSNCQEIESFNVINGFLNFVMKKTFWTYLLSENYLNETYAQQNINQENKILIEFSSPNTNKPLHLGHVRNNLIGTAVSNILEATGNKMIKVNLVNDRGIHICKSMIAWQKWGNGETPESKGIKGDHFVGKYYVEFDKHYKEEIKSLMNDGMSEEDAKNEAPLMKETREMLQKWEAGDEEVLSLWNKMNSWVYEGFNETYKRLGISFDKIYYESQTYLLGKQIIENALEKNILTKDDDNSVWIDLTNEGLDRKLLLRKDGTSVYITQDLGTAVLRHDEFDSNKMIYVVGNEQIYHFDVLKSTLKHLGYGWADSIYHLSYGMVELTTGKMKSREGTVVDADDLMDEMYGTALSIINEQARTNNDEAENLANMVGLAALKYFILKIDPKKQMLFDPNESIDFTGNTGPFIQYTHARICSLLKKADCNLSDIKINSNFINYNDIELAIIKTLHDYPNILNKAADDLSPAIIANYIYELAKQYNKFYQEVNVLKEDDNELKIMRLKLSKFVANVIKNGMKLLGIEVPERM
ncbi:MAG: arginine--tRNA ligase [Bacteroidales bacterium]|jgi:arginyl-tRNA synthetase|nr:arginine--tRNA ligase [Bacteroidales bacterium]